MPFRKNVKLLFWHNFFTDFCLWSPLAIIYFSRVSGSYALGLSVFSATMIANSIFEIPTGIFSDFYGRKSTLVMGAISYFISAVIYALSGNFLTLLIGAIFEGLGRAFYSGNNDALLFDNMAESGRSDEYEKYSGRVSSASQLALSISALGGGFLAVISLRLVIWISVIPQIICIILGLNLSETKKVSTKNDNIFAHIGVAYKNFLENSKLRWVSIANIIRFGIGEASFQFRSAFIATIWPIWAIGISQVLSNVGATLSFYFSGKLIKKFKALPILLTESIYNRVINLVALLFPSIASPVLMSTGSVFFGVSRTAENSLMQREFTQNQRATMGSLISLLGKLFFAVFAIFLGFVADKTSPAKALIMVQLLLFPLAIIYWRLFVIHGKEKLV